MRESFLYNVAVHRCDFGIIDGGGLTGFQGTHRSECSGDFGGYNFLLATPGEYMCDSPDITIDGSPEKFDLSL